MGVAQGLDDWAIPFSFRTRSAVGKSVLFVPRESISTKFAAPLNTGMTPPTPRTPSMTLVSAWEAIRLATSFWDFFKVGSQRRNRGINRDGAEGGTR